MKKMLLVMAVLLLASSAMAEVKVYCGGQPYLALYGDPEQIANEPWKGAGASVTDANLVTVYYDATSEPNLVRAFALDITLADSYLGDNAVITSVTPAVVGESAVGNRGYGIFLGTDGIDINETTGIVNGYGSPVANASDPCAATGIGTKAITIELGSLYGGVQGVSNPNAPAKSGVLCTFRVNDKAATVNIALNARRGGIVMEDPDEVVTTNLVSANILCPGDICGAGFGPRDGICNFWDNTRFGMNWNQVPPTVDTRADLCGPGFGPPDGGCTFWDNTKFGMNWNLSWQ